MRREYEEIVRLEAQYSMNGNMSRQQRSDLRMRYRALNQRIGSQNNGQPIDQGVIKITVNGRCCPRGTPTLNSGYRRGCEIGA